MIANPSRWLSPKAGRCLLWAFAATLARLDAEAAGQGTNPPATFPQAPSFSDREWEQMQGSLAEQAKRLETLRRFPLSNSVAPAMVFDPVPAGRAIPTGKSVFKPGPAPKVRLPSRPEDLAYLGLRELGVLLKQRQVTSVALTRLYLERLRTDGPKLECVVSLTEGRALAEAEQADKEIARGKYRGPLHGIPYVAKDLLAATGAPTTWGAAPYTNQFFEQDATVIRRLREAGAVLIAKTTLGELAMGDVWFGGMTRNPWDVKQGSSGSSAGSAAAVAAGLAPFAIGSETYGSIVSPSTRCGVTGLRPTFGRVSRAGAMALSWSMDKIGPLCRSAEDCALVLHAIQGPDGIDLATRAARFTYDASKPISRLRFGVLTDDFEKEQGARRTNSTLALDALRRAGALLTPVRLPTWPLDAISIVLSTEAAAAFNELTLSDQDDWLKQQDAGSWPNVFRTKRFVPAVEYVQAQRIRSLLMQETARVFDRFDVIVAPAFGGPALLLGNLTGQPCVVVPSGFTAEGKPTSICFLADLYQEGNALLAARTFQLATDHHRRRPPVP